MNSTAFLIHPILSQASSTFSLSQGDFGTDCQQCLSRHFLGPFLRFS